TDRIIEDINELLQIFSIDFILGRLAHLYKAEAVQRSTGPADGTHKGHTRLFEYLLCTAFPNFIFDSIKSAFHIDAMVTVSDFTVKGSKFGFLLYKDFL